jgi:hypothetical protein
MLPMENRTKFPNMLVVKLQFRLSSDESRSMKGTGMRKIVYLSYTASGQVLYDCKQANEKHWRKVD